MIEHIFVYVTFKNMAYGQTSKCRKNMPGIMTLS